VDAVDFSAPMLAIGRVLPNGDHPHLRWFHGAVEELDLDPPYGLITAGSSLHWMEWSTVMPRFRRLLHQDGLVVLVGMSAFNRLPWWPELLPVIQRHSTNRDFQPYDTIAELTARGLFSESGRARTEAVLVSQTIVDYIESFHARNGLSRERMQPADAAAFDAAALEILSPHAVDGMLHWQNQGTLVWGKPDPSP
jgi:ubiquinone/menaquinone biosynthesis C-methylase UbiE